MYKKETKERGKKKCVHHTVQILYLWSENALHGHHKCNYFLQVCDRLTKERNNVQEVIRQEFADRLVATEEENKRLKNEMSEMRARHKLELQRIQESKEEEMEEVHKR